MKNYAPENAHFKLPFRFDPDRLRADLSKCRKYNFLQNYVPSNYNGHNYILPLRSVNGRMDIPTAKAPHIRDALNAKRYVITVVIALMPVVAMATWYYGLIIPLLIL